MMKKIKTKKLDLRGEKCPFTMIHAREAMEKLKADEELEILIVYLPAIETIGQVAFKNNLKFDFEKIEDWIKLTIRK